MDSLLENSNFLEADVEWIVNIDRIEILRNADQDFEKTVALAKRYQKFFPVTVLSCYEAKGHAGALLNLMAHQQGDFIFYLEDDWLCHPELRTQKKLDVFDFLQRMETYSYATCAMRMEQCSFNPCFIRAHNFDLVTRDIVSTTDAEVQVHRAWMLYKKKDPINWAFDPLKQSFFSDIGRLWMKKQPIIKWRRSHRYENRVTYLPKKK